MAEQNITDNKISSMQNEIYRQQNTESKQNKTKNSLMAKSTSRCNASDVAIYNCNTSGRWYMLINYGAITLIILRIFTQCSSCLQYAFMLLMHVNEFVAVIFSVMSTEQFMYGLRLEKDDKCLPCCISMSIESLFFKAVLMQDFVL